MYEFEDKIAKGEKKVPETVEEYNNLRHIEQQNEFARTQSLEVGQVWTEEMLKKKGLTLERKNTVDDYWTKGRKANMWVGWDLKPIIYVDVETGEIISKD